MKISLTILSLIVTGLAFSQSEITFQVDMSQQTVNPAGVHLAGNFFDNDNDGIPENGSLLNWNPAAYQMTDPDMNGVYEITITLTEGRYEYKYINGNNLTDAETVPNACAVDVDGFNNNRQIFVGSAPTTYSACFGECFNCGDNAVRFRVSLAELDYNNNNIYGEVGFDIANSGVHVAGDFQNPNGTNGDWTPDSNAMQDWNGDMIYEAVLNAGQMSEIEFMAINGNSWESPNEDMNGEPCIGTYGKRLVEINNDDVVLPVVCWNSCTPCTGFFPRTFYVDMNNYCGDLSQGVFLTGTPTTWSNGEPMSDTDGDLIYTITLQLTEGDYEYLFRVGTSIWEPGASRTLTVNAEGQTVLLPVCFGSPTACTPLPDPSEITFYLDATDEVIPEGQQVWIFGDFTTLAWQGGAMPLADEDGDSIWSITLQDVCAAQLRYKFVIGLDNFYTDSSWVEESYAFSEFGCGVTNGPFFDLRSYTRSSSLPASVCNKFNTCESCDLLFGCNDSTACNFNPDLMPDPSSCFYQGCTDPEACNYSAQACEGGDCYYPEIEGDTDCSGEVQVEDVVNMLNAFGCIEDCALYDLDGDGIVGVTDLYIIIAMIGVE